MARILTIDIECSPNLAYVWGCFKQNIALSQLVETGEVISFAAKWYDEKKVLFYSVHHDGKDAMVQSAHDLLSEADIVVGYNSKGFDIKHLQREFILAGLQPPAPFHQVDLLHVVKRNFRFTSNKLDHVAQELGLGAKTSHTGFQLWVDCMAGSDKAWNLMRKYNRQDVVLTENLYTRLSPWITGTPSNRLIDGEGAEQIICPSNTCNSHNLQKRGFSKTTLGRYQQYQCQDCGRWARGKKSLDNSDLR